MRRVHITPALVIAIVALFAALGGGAYAAVTTSYVTLTDRTGVRFANVSPAGDVLAAEYNTKNLVRVEADVKSTTCASSGYVVPTGKALVIKSAQYEMETSATGGIGLFADSACSDRIGFSLSDHDNMVPVSYDAGVVVPQGAQISVQAAGAANGIVFFQGYLIPSSAAP